MSNVYAKEYYLKIKDYFDQDIFNNFYIFQTSMAKYR